MEDERRVRVPRVVGQARIRRRLSATESQWYDVLDVHPTAQRPDCLTGYAWLQLPDRIREVHRGLLEFWYDPPGAAMTDAELALLRKIPADEPMIVQVDGQAIADAKALERVVEMLKQFYQVGWIELETWPGKRKRDRYQAAAARLTAEGQRVLGMLGG